MRSILLTSVIALCAFAGLAQSPPGINYQGIARNPDGKPISLKNITIRINIVKDNSNGDVEYSEVHSVQTNSFGLFTLVIGEGQVEAGDFQFISWAVGNKWLRVEMDADGGSSFKVMGSQQFMSVPYAFFSRYSGSSPLTAGQGVAINNNVISNTGDADNNPANEYNTDFILDGDHKLKITDGGGTKEVDLSGFASGGITQDLSLTGNKLKVTNNPSANEIDLTPYLDNTDAQQLNLSGTQLSITGGNNVNLTPFLDNTDNQDLRLTGNTLSLTNDATTINLAPYLDNTDSQNLSFSTAGTNRTIAISGGNSVTIDVADNDSNSTNEIQDLSLTGNTLALSSDATTVNLAPYLDNTDSQNLALSGTQLSISGGNNVNLTPFLDNTDSQNLSASTTGTNRTITISGGNSIAIDVADNDNNSTNEIQDLSLTGNTLTLSSDATTVNLTPYLDNTDNQQLGLMGNSLILDNDATPVDLAPYLDNTDAQTLALSGTTLSILNGNSVNLSGLLDNTDSQDLSLTGNVLSLTGDATPVNLAPYLDNTDSQDLSLAANVLNLTGDATPVNLAPYLDNTDSQDLSLSANVLNLTGDATPVNLAPYLDNTDNQSLSVLNSGDNRTVGISGGTGVTFSVADGDANSTNEIQSLTYNGGTKSLQISLGNSVTIPETQTISNVLTQGNDAGGQKITNLGAPTANTDAVTKQYVDNASATLDARISSNYAFKTGYTFSSLLAVGDATLTLSGESFDDFNVVGTSNFTAPVAGTYLFVLSGTISGGGGLNLFYNGTKYPVPVGGGNFNSTFMFRLSAGETASVVANGLGVALTINGSFYGYKLL
jgi:hypothetical protein